MCCRRKAHRLAMSSNSSDTFALVLADVSQYTSPFSSAYACASSVDTCSRPACHTIVTSYWVQPTAASSGGKSAGQTLATNSSCRLLACAAARCATSTVTGAHLPCLGQVGLVAGQGHDHARVALPQQLLHPLARLRKAVAAADVEHDHRRRRAPASMQQAIAADCATVELGSAPKRQSCYTPGSAKSRTTCSPVVHWR